MTPSEDRLGQLVVVSSVADVRREPTHAAELVSQIICGDTVTPLEHKGDWVYARLDDGYLGWVRSWYLGEVQSDQLAAFTRLARHRIAANHADVLSEPSTGALPVMELVAGTRVRVSGEGPRGWRSVVLCDGKSGYVRAGSVEAVPRAGVPSRERVAATALRFLGVPYLWGGTTTNGFDCSGLVQRVYRLNGLLLPRDSHVQAEYGLLRPMGPEGLQAGDLMFFGQAGRPITHVALAIPGGLFVHAHGQVRIGSLDPAHPDYEPNLHKIWRLNRDPLSRSGPARTMPGADLE